MERLRASLGMSLVIQVSRLFQQARCIETCWLYAISSPRIVPFPVENSPVSIPSRWSIET